MTTDTDFRTMNEFAIPRVEASLANHESWVAAQVRDLFRTINAGDALGINECLDRIGHYLENWLFPRLLNTDQRWHSGAWWIDGLTTRPAQVILPNKLRMHGSAYMQLGSQHEQNPPPPQLGKFDCAYYEPFEFELELGPSSGTIERYCFRFGDDRPLTEKQLGQSVPDELSAHHRWFFTLYGHCAESEWKAQRPARQKYTQVGSTYEYVDDDDDYSRAAAIARFAWNTAIAVRLYMRAEKANDAEASEICLLHLRHMLKSSLAFHMTEHLEWDWNRSARRLALEQLGDALPDVQTPNCLMLRDEALVSRLELEPYREPVAFDIELCPESGDMRSYTYCFGKKQTSTATSSDRWQFVFRWPS